MIHSEKIRVFEAYEIPNDIREKLLSCYNQDDRHFSNGSFVDFLFCQTVYPWDIVTKWFLENGAELNEGYVIIHWDL